jgi:phage terminase large subunit-like protein
VELIGKKAKKTTIVTRKRLKNKGKNMKENIHKKQQEFFESKARNRWIFGGNRTGKTFAGAAEAVRWAIEKKCEGWVVSLSGQVQRDVAQKRILQMLRDKKVEFDVVMLKGKAEFPERGMVDFITVHRKKGGDSIIGFKNLEQGREKFQGTGLDWIWFDEEPLEEIYDECLARLLDKGGSVWCTMTPLKGRTWVYERIYMLAGADIQIFQWEWKDNPYLLESEIKIMERNFSKEALESRKYGRFMEGLGMIFKEFSEENIIKDVSVSSQKNKWVYNGISIDPGYNNPTAVLWFGVDGDDCIFVIDEYKEAGKSIEEIAAVIKEKSLRLGVKIENVFIDSAAAAQNFGQPESVARQFHALGIPVNTKVDKNVYEGIHRVKTLFCSANGVRRLKIFAHCVNLINELRGYFWGDQNKPVKKNDHCIDALRYFAMECRHCEINAKSAIVAPKSSIFEKDKKRRILNERY